jgi:hypothetical protein
MMHTYKSECSILPYRMKALLIAFIFALQTGCAYQNPIPNTPNQDTLGKVAVVTTSKAPVIDVESISQLKGAGVGTAGGAAGGAAAGGIACSALLIGAVLCPICAPAALAGFGTCVGVGAVAGAVVGGVAGATSGATAEEAEKMQANTATLSDTFKARSIQQLLRDQIEANMLARDVNSVVVVPENQQVAPEGSDHSSLAAVGVDTVLEVAFTDVAFKGGRTAALTMSATARLVRTTTSEELFSSSYSWQGRQLKTDELSSHGAEGILKEVQSGYQAMATHIDENIFLLFPFPDRKFVHSKNLIPVLQGLDPSAPRLKYSFFSYFPNIDNLQPTFAWQAFPRELDIKRVPEQMNRVKDVRYDLVIAGEQNNFPGEIIYRRDGLTQNSHQLEISLSPGEHYYWTVRARFELDDRQQLTEWSTTDINNYYKTIDVPNQYSFQFKTSKKNAEQE